MTNTGMSTWTRISKKGPGVEHAKRKDDSTHRYPGFEYTALIYLNDQVRLDTWKTES